METDRKREYQVRLIESFLEIKRSSFEKRLEGCAKFYNKSFYGQLMLEGGLTFC